jgi:hypothetical protein
MYLIFCPTYIQTCHGNSQSASRVHYVLEKNGYCVNSAAKHPSLLEICKNLMLYCGMTRLTLRVVNKNKSILKHSHSSALRYWTNLRFHALLQNFFYLHFSHIDKQCSLISVYR